MFRLLWIALSFLAIFLFWKNRRMRKWILGVALVAVFTSYGYVILREPPQVDFVPVSEVQLEAVEISSDTRITVLRARLTNDSAFDIGEVQLRLQRQDCTVNGCAIIADKTANISVTIPAGQTRAIQGSYSFTNQPEILGEERWQHDLLQLRAVR